MKSWLVGRAGRLRTRGERLRGSGRSPGIGRRGGAPPAWKRGWGARLLALSALLVVGVAPGCATKGDMRDLQLDMDRRFAEVAARQDSVLRALTDGLRALDRQTQGALEDAATQSTEGVGDLRRQITLRFEAVDKQLSEIKELIGQLMRDIASLRDLMEVRRTVVAAPPPGTFGDSAFEDPQSLYDQGVTQFKRGSMTAARIAFAALLDLHPAHDLVPGARFYLAQMLEADEELEEARDAFLAIEEDHPKAEKAGEALYRAGKIELRLDNAARAKELFQLVVARYGESPAAALADEELKKL